jgi:hypothetical protein
MERGSKKGEKWLPIFELGIGINNIGQVEEPKLQCVYTIQISPACNDSGQEEPWG